MPLFCKDLGQVVKTPIRAFNEILALRAAFAEKEEFHCYWDKLIHNIQNNFLILFCEC